MTLDDAKKIEEREPADEADPAAKQGLLDGHTERRRDLDVPAAPKEKTAKDEQLNRLVNSLETVGDLKELKLNQLLALEDKFEGILLYVFTDVADKDEKLDFKNWKGYREIQPGTKLTIDFRGNKEAFWKVGAGDILPPAVRAISVVEGDGDNRNVRTSVKRIGLKGRGSHEKGFFDERGYMPIFTGNSIIVGGEKEPEKGVDREFDKYRKVGADGKPGELDYERYEQEHGAEDQEFYKKNVLDNPLAQRTKAISGEDATRIMEASEASGMGKKAAEKAIAVAEARDNLGLGGASCCFDWVSKIYHEVGATRRQYFDSLSQYGGKDCGEAHAGPEQYAGLRPGDHIFYNVFHQLGQAVDSRGNHSAIFLGWEDKDNLVARLASGSYGTTWHFHEKPTDFNKAPITRIYKPV
ncbi:hypothetical protein HZA40_04615 [Candidatus Peregrinibacteria bacterium]|nr:hypothetical protein [Candidatus Peregrinibacteria bacterium]